jgi:phosphoesterase RecJ-like protein
MKYDESVKIKQILDSAQEIVVVQADNPDADSLGSSLALEAILDEQGKNVTMYCPVDMPDYIKYLQGWDRVGFKLPNQFDTVIFVDVSTLTLLEKSKSSGDLSQLLAKNVIVIDHHANVGNKIETSGAFINDGEASSAGEVIYGISDDLGWDIPADALDPLMSSILGDTQGLTNSLATANTYKVMSELITRGANRPRLEERRREYSKMPEIIFKYKADLIKRTKLVADNSIAYVVVPQDEISKFSPLYNPAPLIQTDMLQTQGVRLAIVFKTYDDRRVTAALRSNLGSPVAGAIAEEMGGGGHDLASGFKVLNVNDFDKVINETINLASQKLQELK